MVEPIPTLDWEGDADGTLWVLDQTRLPVEERPLRIDRLETLIEAIVSLRVRGAPAIGVAAGYGCVLAARVATSPETLATALEDLASSRPTAVNLFGVLEQQRRRIREHLEAKGSFDELPALLLAGARKAHEEDRRLCEAMGRHGAALVPDGGRVLTHCNTGRLATAGIGTALGVLFTAWEAGNRFEVLADETRPLLQGARLTMFELQRAGIPVELLLDAAAPGLILDGQVQAVFVGADRIARNGDTANKVGTLPLALACRQARVPFYVVAPSTSFDPDCPDGSAIPIEEREAQEVLEALEPDRIPAGSRARNPAFDRTPAALVSAFVTEHGVHPDADTAFRALLGVKASDASGR